MSSDGADDGNFEMGKEEYSELLSRIAYLEATNEHHEKRIGQLEDRLLKIERRT